MIVQYLIEDMLSRPEITAEVANRIWPMHAPDAPAYPYLVVSKVSGDGQYDFQGDAGIERARVQVDVYGLQYADVVALKSEVRSWLTRRPPPAPVSSPCAIDSVLCINDMDLPAGNPEGATERAGPRIRRRVLEFTVWAKP